MLLDQLVESSLRLLVVTQRVLGDRDAAEPGRFRGDLAKREKRLRALALEQQQRPQGALRGVVLRLYLESPANGVVSSTELPCGDVVPAEALPCKRR